MKHTNIDTEKKYVKIKPEVYEQLAKTFFDKRKKKGKKSLWFIILFLILVFFIVFYVFSVSVLKKNFFSKSLYVFQVNEPVVIEYDFTSLGNSKIRALSFNLNNLDLAEYKYLDLSIRTGEKAKIDSTIKVQIENSILEKDAQYLTGINNKWKRIKLPLNKFNLIKNWKTIKAITFIVEEWNVSNKKDKFYIDELSFVE